MQNEKTSPWLIAFRVIFTIALFGSILFIFHNSLEDAALSSARSQEVMHLLNAILGKVHLGPLSEHTVRKLAHFAEFTLLGFWLMMCLRVYTRHFVRHTSWPLLGGMTTALADETLQRFISGRSSQVTDVWIDMAGVVAGLFVALLILLLVRMITTLHAVKKENRRLRAENEAYERRQREAEHARLAHRAARRAYEDEPPAAQPYAYDGQAQPAPPRYAYDGDVPPAAPPYAYGGQAQPAPPRYAYDGDVPPAAPGGADGGYDVDAYYDAYYDENNESYSDGV